ncbi:hypothetical protein BH11CYA1_BH11CYA1_45870 [soil metagenome]
MELPIGWVECPDEQHTGSDFIKEFRAPESEEIKLTFYYRGKRIGAGGAADFLAVLALPDHELSEEEFISVDLVVRNASDPEYFLLSSSRTETMNGKRVLLVEGIWSSGIVDMAMFIDSDKTGSAVQEVHYQAPEKDFGMYVEQVDSSFKTIVWL